MPIGDGGSNKKELDEIESLHDVPAINSLNNDYIRDVLGNKNDNSLQDPGAASLYQIAAYMAYYHVHNQSLIYPRDGAPESVIAGAGAYNEGAKYEIIPADEIDKSFDIHFANLGAISEVDDYVLKLYTGDAGSEEFWAECSFSRDTNQMRAAYIPIQGDPIPPNTRVSATLMSGNGSNNVQLKLYTHRYL
jgi:hypothetical protein